MLPKDKLNLKCQFFGEKNLVPNRGYDSYLLVLYMKQLSTKKVKKKKTFSQREPMRHIPHPLGYIKLNLNKNKTKMIKTCLFVTLGLGFSAGARF